MEYKNRCEGWRKHGGLMTFGLPEWRQCENEGTVLIEFKDNKKLKILPACNTCWNEMIEAKEPKIIKVSPIVDKVSA